MSTKKYWRGLEEINPSEEYKKKQAKEFSEDLSIADEVAELADKPTSRRDFLKYLGFTTVAATVAASCEMPVRNAIPYAIKPEGITPGVPLTYASTFVDAGEAIPALVKVRDGRPIKIEGNPDSKLFGGATHARMQASILNLYDATRLQYPTIGGKKSKWADVDSSVMNALAGGNVYLVSSTQNSPSGTQVINNLKSKYGATHITYDALSYSGLLDANEKSFGKRAIPTYRFDLAKTIVSLGADFLGTWINPALYSKQYAKGRKISAKNPNMSKHIQFEGMMSMTGANSDERYPCKPSEYGKIAAAIYSALSGGSVNLGNEYLNKGIAQAAASLKKGGMVVSGSNDPKVQTIVNGINSAIGAFGSSISWSNTDNTKQGDDKAMAQFATALKSGGVSTVIFLNCNPVYEHPKGAEIAKALKSVKMSVSLSDRADETASKCKIIAPVHHALESWSDAEPISGYTSFMQPTIPKLFDTRQWQETLLKWSGDDTDWFDYFENYWSGKLGGRSGFDKAVQLGVSESGDLGVGGGGSASGVAEAVSAVTSAAASKGTELVIYPTVAIGHGGVWSNNPWLQEMPDPISKCTWDNYAMISQNYAKTFDAKWTDNNEVERGKKVLKITTPTGTKNLPLIVVPGMHDDVIAIAMGYGRGEGAGNAANGTGVDVTPLLGKYSDGNVQYNISNVKVDDTGEEFDLAIVQTHHSYDGRPILWEYTLDEFQKDPKELYNYRKNLFEHYTHSFDGDAHGEGHGDAHGGGHEKAAAHGAENAHGAEAKHGAHEAHGDGDWQEAFRDNGTLYHMDQHPNHGIKWGMSIDLSSCIGCGACTIACQAENNVSVVGKEQVLLVHDMHWLRIDRYFSGDPEKSESIQTVFQPMLCQHCDNAPCENVCPVNATNHSSEGLNQMAYNRCIGTRYCANNCPYKVRRFNWRDWNEADSFRGNTFTDGKRDDVNNNVTRMVLNPDVTVRSRGVMEKCTFCVQRLQTAKREAKKENRVMGDQEAVTACQTACPTHAIEFGNVKDKNSAIYQLRNKEQKERVFYTLEEIHTLPNINYLSKIRNSDKAIGRELDTGVKGHSEEAHG